jgi:hypothetical protein
LGFTDTRQACSREYPGSAISVQNLDDERGLETNSHYVSHFAAFFIIVMWEPRHPLVKVVL